MPQVHHPMGTRQRALTVLLLLLQFPSRYTRKQIADKLEVSRDTITNIFKDMEYVGFLIESDENHRYRLKASSTAYRQLY